MNKLAGKLAVSLIVAAWPLVPSAAAAQTVQTTPAATEPGDRTAATRQKARAMVESGLAFLKSKQQADGSWQPDARVPPAITALALRAAVNAPGASADDDFITKGYDALLKQQVTDGGIYADTLANYNTSIAVSALTAAQERAGDERYQPQIDKAVAYVRRLQWGAEPRASGAGEKDVAVAETDAAYGGWGYGGRQGGRPDLSNAQIALEALRDAGVKPDDPAFQRAVRFVTKLQNRSETNPSAWAGDDGGFVYSPGGDRTGESMAGEYVSPDGRRMLRSYGSMTYAGLKSMVYAGLAKDDPRVKAAFDWATARWTLDANPGMADAAGGGESGLYYYYLTLARALHAYDQPTIPANGGQVDWRVALVDALTKRQKPDGSWAGEARFRESDPVLVTAYGVLALENVLDDLDRHPAE